MTKRKQDSFLMGFISFAFIALWVSLVLFEILHINNRSQFKDLLDQKVTFSFDLNKETSPPLTQAKKKSYVSILIEDNEDLEIYKIVDLLPQNISFGLSIYNKNLEQNIATLKEKQTSYLLNLPLSITHGKSDRELDLYKGMPINEIATRVKKIYNKGAGGAGFYNMGENEEFLNDREGLEALVKNIYALNSILVYGVNNKTSVLEPYGDLSFAVNSSDLNITTEDELKTIESLQNLEAIAVKKGKAIGVLRANNATFKALQKWNNEIKKESTELVSVGEIMKEKIGEKNAQ